MLFPASAQDVNSVFFYSYAEPAQLLTYLQNMEWKII